MIKLIRYFTQYLIVRYLVSGGTAASVNLLVFSLFFYVFHWHYLLSNIIAFIVAFGVSLTLQKLWTFQDRSTQNMHIQGLLYLFNSLFGLVVNTFLLYVSVHFLNLLPIVGVVIAGAGTALCTFSISRKYIFNKGTQ